MFLAELIKNSELYNKKVLPSLAFIGASILACASDTPSSPRLYIEERLVIRDIRIVRKHSDSGEHSPQKNKSYEYTKSSSQVYLDQITSARDFFLLDNINLGARVLLLEDDVGPNMWDIATMMFQRAADTNKPFGESITDGSYSGVHYKKNAVPKRALFDSYTDEQIQTAFDMINALQSREPPYRTDGADSFRHVNFPSGVYSLDELLYNANFDEEFRKTYGFGNDTKERVVVVSLHSTMNGYDRYLFGIDSF